MKTLIFILIFGQFSQALAVEDLEVSMADKIQYYSTHLNETATDLNEEWFLYRRMIRFTVSGQVSVGVARIELTPEIEIIQER